MLMRPLRSTLLATFACLIGCNGGDGTDIEPGGDIVASSLNRNLTPSPTPEELEALADGNHALTFELYRATAGTTDNYMISTLSIRSAFAMMYAGAQGSTADEMSAALGFSTDQSRLHEAMNALDLTLASRQLPADSDNDLGAVELRQANAFWGRTGEPWLSGYLDTLAINYGAGIRTVDFAGNPEAVRSTINDWVEAQTNDRIQDLLPPGSIEQDTLSVLTNAIYFKAPWQTPFLPSFSPSDSFTLANDTTTNVDYMSRVIDAAHASADGWTAVELGYRGDALSMVLLIPDAGTFSAFDAALSEQQITTAIASLQPAKVDMTMPKFEFKTDFTLSAALKDMGMPTAFSNAANFSGMLDSGDIKIEEAYHQTFIAVDEEGTEAAAATAVVAIPTSLPVIDHTVRADRPFYFLIRDRETNIWLFFGRVMDPSA